MLLKTSYAPEQRKTGYQNNMERVTTDNFDGVLLVDCEYEKDYGTVDFKEVYEEIDHRKSSNMFLILSDEVKDDIENQLLDRFKGV